MHRMSPLSMDRRALLKCGASALLTGMLPSPAFGMNAPPPLPQIRPEVVAELWKRGGAPKVVWDRKYLSGSPRILVVGVGGAGSAVATAVASSAAYPVTRLVVVDAVVALCHPHRHGDVRHQPRIEPYTQRRDPASASWQRLIPASL